MSNTPFPNGWDNIHNRLQKEEVAGFFDNDRRQWLDDNNKPRCCYICPFSVWYADYKRCTALQKQLHPYFRTDARLKDCPVRVDGLSKG